MTFTAEESTVKEEPEYLSHVQILSKKARRNLARFKKDKVRNPKGLRGKDPLINYILEELI